MIMFVTVCFVVACYIVSKELNKIRDEIGEIKKRLDNENHNEKETD